MLWLSLYFPTLTLDVAERGTTGTEPLAILEVAGSRPRILQCNRAAAEQGVHAGMSLNAALVLIPDLHCRNRDESLEREALQRLASWAFQYSPMVVLGQGPEILLEIEGSLSLFRGLDALCGQVQGALTQLGYTPRLAVAPFPETASLFARGKGDVRVLNPSEATAALGQLSINVLELDEPTGEKLRSLGISRVSDLLAVPSEGLRRRFGSMLTDRLERALGKRPDPRRPWRRPSRFRATLELPAAAHTTEPLLFVLRRLLKELAEVLAALGKGVDRLEILLRHDRKHTTRLSFGLAKQSRDAEHWLTLLRARFDGMLFEQPVQAVELRAPRFFDLKATSGELFGDRTSKEEQHLMDRLRARLGDAAVRGVDLVEDHRPERAWRTVAPQIAVGYEPPYNSSSKKFAGQLPKAGRAAANDAVYRSEGKLSRKIAGARSRCTMSDTANPRRPLWLLLSPVPLAREAHKEWRLRNPERIEAGWWDGNDIARDYYLAETPRGERLWVFRDLRNRGWYLHGVFS